MPYIENARFDSKQNAIRINVRYRGGCSTHQFRLETNPCRESFPVQCDSELIDLTVDDSCKRLVKKTILISLKDAELDTDYYRGASITLKGSGGSKRLVVLP